MTVPASHAALLRDGLTAGFNGIARGQGRSYGDSALAAELLHTARVDELLSLDDTLGLLHCAAGVTLAQILCVLVPRGWFLPVVPGTAQVSVGGAIASDVHGKNHHLDGCFSEHLQQLTLLGADGSTQLCSATSNSELFHATCGGMGLTGIITSAVLKLRRISTPLIHQQTLRTSNLNETLDLLKAHHNNHYSVAWLDCMATGDALGRSLLFLGEHAEGEHEQTGGTLETSAIQPRLSVPFSTPAWLLNRYSMRAFNSLYYHHTGRLARRRSKATVPWQSYFFPLDSIGHWNRLYGQQGLQQYQFVLPASTAAAGITDILKRVTASGRGSFLSVLKRLGPANRNLLSFPMDGYTLALDFRHDADLLLLLDSLDQRVLHYGGRLYLSKDARMSRETFRRSYPQWQAFVDLRRTLGAHAHFNSLQSQRLGL